MDDHGERRITRNILSGNIQSVSLSGSTFWVSTTRKEDHLPRIPYRYGSADQIKAQSRQARAVSLYDLADMLGHESDPDFLLKGVDNFRTRKRRMRTIESQLPEVLAGLARATRTYASSIVQGDTSIFPEVMKFYVAKQKRLYPSMSLPPGVLDDPS